MIKLDTTKIRYIKNEEPVKKLPLMGKWEWFWVMILPYAFRIIALPGICYGAAVVSHPMPFPLIHMIKLDTTKIRYIKNEEPVKKLPLMGKWEWFWVMILPYAFRIIALPGICYGATSIASYAFSPYTYDKTWYNKNTIYQERGTCEKTAIYGQVRVAIM